MHRNKKVGIKAHKKRMEDKEANQSAALAVMLSYAIVLAMFAWWLLVGY